MVLADETNIVLQISSAAAGNPEFPRRACPPATGRASKIVTGISPPSQMVGGIKPGRPGADTATRSVLGFSRKVGGAIFPCFSSQSEANRFSEEMAIGSSISPRLHMFSQG